jgi:hypothetical protein
MSKKTWRKITEDEIRTPEYHGMRSRGWLEIGTLGSSSWMPYAPQGVNGLDDDG